MQKVLNGGKLSAPYLASMGTIQGTLRISRLIDHRRCKSVITRQAELALRLCRSIVSALVGCIRELPFACVRAAIYVQCFPSGEGGVDQEQNCIYDFFDFTHPAERVQPFQKFMGLRFMHRSIDSA